MKERKTARVERGAGYVPVEPGNEEQMEDRQAVASGEDERQHDDNRMRDTSTLVKNDRRQRTKNHLTNGGRQ